MLEHKTLEIDGQEVTFYVVAPPALALSRPPRRQADEWGVVARTRDRAIAVATVGPGTRIDDFEDATLERWYRAARAHQTRSPAP